LNSGPPNLVPRNRLTVVSIYIVYSTDNRISRASCMCPFLVLYQLINRSSRLKVISQEIDGISLHNPIPIKARIYGLPFLSKLDRPRPQSQAHRQHSIRYYTTRTITDMRTGSFPKNGHSFTVSSYSLDMLLLS
jgi:hypothetical protein